MLNECSQDGCTVGTTGQCLLNHDPAVCPSRLATLEEPTEVAEELLPEPEHNPSFSPSGTLTEDSLGALMADRYCTLIGIIGAPDSGKTAVLVSTYLLLSHGNLEGFEYADSKSLIALDEISRGARRWSPQQPDQMTAHTELGDDRAAGFLHLRIHSHGCDIPVDFLLPDLPGEWSDSMVDASRYERLAFLSRADVIWLMVDGSKLAAAPTRQLYLHRTQLYLQRLIEFFPNLPPVMLVLTRCDLGAVSQKTIEALMTEGEELGIRLAVRSIASFSKSAETPAGTGIAELINASTVRASEKVHFWPKSDNVDENRAIETTVRGGLVL